MKLEQKEKRQMVLHLSQQSELDQKANLFQKKWGGGGWEILCGFLGTLWDISG